MNLDNEFKCTRKSWLLIVSSTRQGCIPVSTTLEPLRVSWNKEFNSAKLGFEYVRVCTTAAAGKMRREIQTTNWIDDF